MTLNISISKVSEEVAFLGLCELVNFQWKKQNYVFNQKNFYKQNRFNFYSEGKIKQSLVQGASLGIHIIRIKRPYWLSSEY